MLELSWDSFLAAVVLVLLTTVTVLGILRSQGLLRLGRNAGAIQRLAEKTPVSAVVQQHEGLRSRSVVSDATKRSVYQQEGRSAEEEGESKEDLKPPRKVLRRLLSPDPDSEAELYTIGTADDEDSSSEDEEGGKRGRDGLKRWSPEDLERMLQEQRRYPPVPVFVMVRTICLWTTYVRELM